MRQTLFACAVVALLALAGCSKNGKPLDDGIGEAGISGGTGGDGSGPTGTGGDQPGFNPGADSKGDNGTGGP